MLCVAILCDAILHYAMPRHAVTYYALPCSSTPCYAVLYHASRTFLLLLLFLPRLQALEGRGDDDDDDDDDDEAVVLLLLGPTPSLPALAARGPRRAGRSGGRASGAASAAAASEAAPLRRNGPDHLSRGISEPRVWRMSQAKRPIPDNSETRVVRMSQAKRPGPPDFVEDVSALLSLGRS